MLQNLVTAATLGSEYVLIAIGLTMVYGMLRILHVAHAAVYTLGAFVALEVSRAFGGGVWLGLVAAAAVSGVAGVLIYELVYRPILDRSPLVALIASVGLFVLAQALFQQEFLFGVDIVPFTPETFLPRIATDWVRINPAALAVYLMTAGLVIALLVAFRRTRVGLEWRGIAMDRHMADAVGVPVHRSMVVNFFVGSAMAGVGGALVGLSEGQVFATMGSVPAYKAFVVVVMGGLGSVPGAIVAGYLLGLLETYTIVYFGYLLPRDAIAFIILIAFLMFRPQGLFGGRLR